MFMQKELILLALFYASASYSFHQGYSFPKQFGFGNLVKVQQGQPSTIRMSMVAEAEESIKTSSSKPFKPTVDFSAFAVGQEHEGTVTNVQPFGVFVQISAGVDVLLPRSTLSAGNYNKLKALFDAKSKEPVKFSLIGVSAEKQTLSGKYITPNYKQRPDLSTLDSAEVVGKNFQAKVVSTHDFGLFARIEELGGVEGLVPSSKLPPSTAASSFAVDSEVTVRVEEINIAKQRLLFSMRGKGFPQGEDGNNADLSLLPQEKWMQAIVQKVTAFGLFLRPAGYDMTILLHVTRVPRDLVSALKKRMPDTFGPDGKAVSASGKGDLELLFSKGDVMKVRVETTTIPNRPMQVSMLPPRRGMEPEAMPELETTETSSTTIAEGLDTSAIEREIDEEFKSYEDDGGDFDSYEEKEPYDAQSLLLWWRGAPYEKASAEKEATVVDEDALILTESPTMVVGNWRRMFELDMMEDVKDGSSKALEAEEREMREEIGELEGIHMDLADPTGLDLPPMSFKVGSTFSMPGLPDEWKAQMDFFQEIDQAEKQVSSKMKGGKASESVHLQSLLREIEQELANAQQPGRGRRGREEGEAPAN